MFSAIRGYAQRRTRGRKELAFGCAALATGGTLYYLNYQNNGYHPRKYILLDEPEEDSPTIPSPDSSRFKRVPTRAANLKELKDASKVWDLVIVGGGATGTGCALDAAARGLDVALVEKEDFASGTSSRSTKLVHGGVRYLEKAFWSLDYDQYKLVKEALSERATFLHIAPYLSFAIPIMIPVYKWWQVPYFWAGTKAYDFLAGKENLNSSYYLTPSKALEHFPMLKANSLKGALVYYDGQHNDSRMNVAIACTAAIHGATVANHVQVNQLLKDENEKINGVVLRDELTGDEWKVKSKGVINATGPFSDSIRKMDVPDVREIVAPSSGVHVILPGYYSPNDMGLIDPNTSDGRVIFFLPFLNNTIAGTTDSPTKVEVSPLPKEEEVDFILNEVRKYLSADINVRRQDVLAAWSGIRPLVRDPAAKNTESLVRNHMINVSESGLLTIAGGKWTTYRQMAEEAIDKAIEVFNLSPKLRSSSNTRDVQLIGTDQFRPMLYVSLIQEFGFEEEVARHLCSSYGSRAWAVAELCRDTGARWPIRGTRLVSHYPFLEGEVRYCAREEYAEGAMDILARRTRLAFLNAHAALEALPRVIDLMAEEKGWSERKKAHEWDYCVKYLLSMGLPAAKKDVTRKQVENGDVSRRPESYDYQLYKESTVST